MLQRAQSIPASSLELLLKPLVRLCLRHSLQIQDAIEALKNTFVAVAQEELARSGKTTVGLARSGITSPSVSRLSAMTGMHRRDVSRLLRGAPPSRQSENLISRVIGQWRSNRKFTAPSGGPRVLRVDSKRSEFAELVSSISKDLNPYTVLLELERLGYVRATKRGVKLIARSYIPTGDIERGLSLLASDSADLLAAVEENLFYRNSSANLHLKTEFDNVPEPYIEQIRQWLLDEGSAFHERAFHYLSQFDADVNPAAVSAESGDSAAPRRRVSVGTFSCTFDASDRSLPIESINQAPVNNRLPQR